MSQRVMPSAMLSCSEAHLGGEGTVNHCLRGTSVSPKEGCHGFDFCVHVCVDFLANVQLKHKGWK